LSVGLKIEVNRQTMLFDAMAVHLKILVGRVRFKQNFEAKKYIFERIFPKCFSKIRNIERPTTFSPF
jgi:hypothetical protein